MKHPSLVALDLASERYEAARAAHRTSPSADSLHARAAARRAFFLAQDAAEQAGALPSLDHALRPQTPGATK